MTRAYLKARYSYPLFSRNQRGYLYVWMRDARYAYGMNAEVYACRPGIQLPYRELPPVDRSGDAQLRLRAEGAHPFPLYLLQCL